MRALNFEGTTSRERDVKIKYQHAKKVHRAQKDTRLPEERSEDATTKVNGHYGQNG